MRSPPPVTEGAQRDLALFTGAALSFAALVIPALLVPVRDRLDNANVALVLMGLVVAAGVIAGRGAACCVAAVGATAFNFFHTRPYGTLKMADGNDIIATALLVVCGLGVGEIAVRRTRRATDAAARALDLESLESVAATVADAPLVVTWDRTRAEIARVLRTDQVWFEGPDDLTPAAALPWLDRRGVHGVRDHRWAGEGFALPAEGLQIAVGHEPVRGRVVVQPRGRAAVSRGAHAHVLALCGLLASAIDVHPDEVAAIESP